jgi:hypothetical protein
MAHFAEIVNGVVERVVVVHNNELLVNGIESEIAGAHFCETLFDGQWVQTSYNNGPIEGKTRGKFANIGDIWDGNEFVTPD